MEVEQRRDIEGGVWDRGKELVDFDNVGGRCKNRHVNKCCSIWQIGDSDDSKIHLGVHVVAILSTLL